jgi:hypothetical protein
MAEVIPSANLVVPRFYNLPVINEAGSAKHGRPIYEDKEICELRFSGNRMTVGVFPAHEVFRKYRDPETGEVTEITYAIEYRDQYLKFKNNETQELSGTPLSELPFLTQSKRLELKALNIHTAEALAALDGQPLKQLGMGGRELKVQAQTYLENAKGSADVLQLARTNAALEARIAQLEGRATTPAEGTGDDYVPDEPAAVPEKPGTSPFAIMAADDIKNWIADATGERPKGNPSHATLVARADEVNAELAKKAKPQAA